MDDFKDKVVAITGASSGVGRAIAEAFGAAGAKVALIARNQEALANAATTIVEAGSLRPLARHPQPLRLRRERLSHPRLGEPRLTIQALAARTADYLLQQGAEALAPRSNAEVRLRLGRELSPPGTHGHRVPRLT